MQIRDATPEDWEAIWPIVRDVIREGATIPYAQDLDEEDARALWMVDRTVVAVDDDGRVVGTANMYANRGGGGAHVSSATFMVASDARGRGAGRALGEEVIRWSREAGFRAIQFNAVVETNVAAVRLWESLGFEIVGTVPEAFEHPADGFVGLHVMYRFLR
jgi:L-amino acid N-acyltransferase YncA